MKDMSMKAVKRLGKSCKNLFKMDNARVLLLEMAKDYLNHSQLEEATDKQYGKGVTKIHWISDISVLWCRKLGINRCYQNGNKGNTYWYFYFGFYRYMM